jgi:hypothetical protein
VLGIDLGDVGIIAAAIQKRHDIVHRNGRQKDGALVRVETSDVTALVIAIGLLGARIDMILNPMPPVDLDEKEAPF